MVDADLTGTGAGDSDVDARDVRIGLASLAVVVAYLAVWGYGEFTGDPTAQTVANLLFGLVLIGFGVLYVVREELTPLVSTAGAALTMAGVAAIGFVVTGVQTFSTLSDVGLLIGVGLYFFRLLRG
jgi:FtsH-binding integral membrane protein